MRLTRTLGTSRKVLGALFLLGGLLFLRNGFSSASIVFSDNSDLLPIMTRMDSIIMVMGFVGGLVLLCVGFQWIRGKKF